MNNTHKTDLTLLEKAVLTHLYFHNIKDWKPYYLALNPGTRAKAENLPGIVSTFRRSEKVQTYIATLKSMDKVRQVHSLNTNDGQTKDGKLFSDGKKDFTNIQDFLQYCNEQANNTTNEKDRQQYLKFISDLLSFKNSGNETKTDIQRFYSPIQCGQCPLYQKESK